MIQCEFLPTLRVTLKEDLADQQKTLALVVLMVELAKQ